MRAGARASQLATQLRDRLARHPRSGGLVGWQSYYRNLLEPAPGIALIDHRGAYLGDAARQAELIDAIAAGRTAFLISAPAGCGKSRFALELARRLERAQRSWVVRFVRHEESTLGEELQALAKEGRLILIVDDAHDCPALVQRLASVCAGRGAPTHLICLTRPAGRAALTEALASDSPLGPPLALDLGRPGPKVIRELIDALIPQLSPHHRDVIRRSVADSFFATVLLCGAAARQKKLPQTLSVKSLREYAVRQPIARAIGDLCPPEKALRALAVYAACAPVRAGDAAIRSSAATHAALPIADIERLERCVVQAGLFEADEGGRMRPAPDLLGDLILEETCVDEQGQRTPFGQSLLRALLDQGRYERVICHCADIARLISSPQRMDLLSELMWERADSLAPHDRAQAAELLQGCSLLAAREPDLIVRLIEALTANGVLRIGPPGPQPSQADDPEVQAQRLLMSAAEADPAVVPRAFEYSRRLLAQARNDDPGRRALLDGLTDACQFAVARPPAHAAAVLDVLTRWAQDSEPQTAELAAALVRGFLRLKMRARRWDQHGPTPATTGLDPADETCRLREQALEILVRCAGHASPAVALAAATSLSHWAQGYGELAGEPRRRWEPQLTRELERLTATFAKLGSATAHAPVRAAVEQQGWQWWMSGPEPWVRRGGGLLLEALPAADTYSLWKALHAATLPIFPLPLDESLEPETRRERLLPLIEPAAERAVELSRELFDRLDRLGRGSSAWSALFASAVSAQPSRPLQPRARLYLKEFIARHPEEAWSFVSEEAATGPVGALLPALLAELRGESTSRWHEAIEGAVPGTRLFELQLGALCATGDLDSVERAVVSKGLQLEDAQIVHRCAKALLSAAQPALADGLAAVFAALPRRPADAPLWELTLDAFARWGDPLLTSSASGEVDGAAREASGELLRLLRTAGSAMSWEEGPHTRCLARVLAIFAVTVPHTLKTWIRQDGVPAAAGAASGLVLTPARLSEVASLLRSSSAASFWQKQFAEWITEEPDLAGIGAAGLSALCGLGDPCIPPLIAHLAQQPSESSLEALRELIGGCARSPKFVEDALTLFRHLAEAPEACGLLEKELIATLTQAGRARAGSIEGRTVALKAIDAAARDADLPEALRQALMRVRQAIQGAIEDDLLRGHVR
jgi:hypothetical protein